MKDSVQGGIYVSGSAMLARALITDGLVDELHLFMFPVTRGAGPRLFPEYEPRKWSLTRAETCNNGVLYLTYQPAV